MVCSDFVCCASNKYSALFEGPFTDTEAGSRFQLYLMLLADLSGAGATCWEFACIRGLGAKLDEV